jgi:nucleotide-binding universal stress UspA family protein
VFKRIVVPTDESDYSWRAVATAEALARQWDAEIELLEVVSYAADVMRAEAITEQRLAAAPLSVPFSVCARVLQRSVGATIADHVANVGGGLIVMSTFGRGRSEAILGSVALDVLRAMVGPVVAIGPKSKTDRTDHRGELIVPVDGSEFSETALPLAAAWATGLEARPWVVEVLDPEAHERFEDAVESSHATRLARNLTQQTHLDAQFEVLHSTHPGRAIAEFAASIDASLIVASTHGRTGFARLALGSVAMEMVRHASCPVVLQRPPTLVRES